MNKRRSIGIGAAIALVIVGTAYVFTAPHPGNTGWQRTPGVRTLTLLADLYADADLAFAMRRFSPWWNGSGR
jgi:hypothetical protein